MVGIPLTTQAYFEELWSGCNTTGPMRWLILFTKRGCAPCSRLDKDAIESAAHAANAAFFICDAAQNKYTPAYCDVFRFPTFQLMEPGKVLGSLTSSDTAAVVEWLSSFT